MRVQKGVDRKQRTGAKGRQDTETSKLGFENWLKVSGDIPSLHATNVLQIGTNGRKTVGRGQARVRHRLINIDLAHITVARDQYHIHTSHVQYHTYKFEGLAVVLRDASSPGEAFAMKHHSVSMGSDNVKRHVERGH